MVRRKNKQVKLNVLVVSFENVEILWRVGFKAGDCYIVNWSRLPLYWSGHRTFWNPDIKTDRIPPSVRKMRLTTWYHLRAARVRTVLWFWPGQVCNGWNYGNPHGTIRKIRYLLNLLTNYSLIDNLTRCQTGSIESPHRKLKFETILTLLTKKCH